MKTFIRGTFLSILVFCTVSFATVLLHISRLGTAEDGPLYIGFPFTYLTQREYTEATEISWSADYLVYDCLLTWVLIVGACFLLQHRKVL